MAHNKKWKLGRDPNHLGWLTPDCDEGFVSGKCPRCKGSNIAAVTIIYACGLKEMKCQDCQTKWQESLTDADYTEAKEKGLI